MSDAAFGPALLPAPQLLPAPLAFSAELCPGLAALSEEAARFRAAHVIGWEAVGLVPCLP